MENGDECAGVHGEGGLGVCDWRFWERRKGGRTAGPYDGMSAVTLITRSLNISIALPASRPPYDDHNNAAHPVMYGLRRAATGTNVLCFEPVQRWVAGNHSCTI